MKPSWPPLAELSSSPLKKRNPEVTRTSMDSADICAATSEGDNRRRANQRNRDWHKRFNLRRTAVRPPAMQSADKSGPEKIAGEYERGAAKKPPDTPGVACALCEDESEYAPNDLVRHFGENHGGSLPVFSCRLCAFSTQELSRLQVHLLSHEDTFSSCSVCHDDVQRTWPELSAHLTAVHCHDDRFPCQMCRKFSTGDVGVFLEHTYAHHSGLEGDAGPSPHAEGRDEFAPKMAAGGLHCQHCGYEASRKWLIAKHVKAVHVCQNGNQRKKKKKEEEVRYLAMKPNVPVPKVKPRLTRSAVREMCWLTQDCLSLPGREFLDKYCPLSDPQTTLQETQQFLMQSVAGETGDRKWTKALKSVLSSVPQDMNVHPKSEKGVASNPSDLAVLTVKNKITVAQNGATYAKRLKVMTSSEKETSRRVVDRNGCQSNPSTTNPNRVVKGKNGASRELKHEQETVDQGKKNKTPPHEDGMDISAELKPTKESEEHTSGHKVAPKTKRRRLRRRASAKRRSKRPSGVALKIVLKKNPVKEKQWVSLSPSSDLPGAPCPQAALQETAQVLKNTPLDGVRQEERPSASSAGLGDPSEAVASSPPSQAAMPARSNNRDNDALRGSPAPHREAKVDGSRLAREAGRSESPAAAGSEVEVGLEDAVLQTSGGGTECQGFDDEGNSAANGAAPLGCSTTKSSAASVVPTQGKANSEGVFLVLAAEQEGTGDTGLPAELRPHLHSGVHGGTSPPSGRQRSPLAKHVERTLKLVAISRFQPVKRPAGDQPVVVLNHPDADTPEVARIMEVIHRYKGEVQKVVLSRKTADALSAEASDPEDSAGCASVQERFLLRLKFRRLSRKKYEVVGAGSPGVAAGASVFRCWFCGRVLACREAWTAHRQRHLTDWEKAKL